MSCMQAKNVNENKIWRSKKFPIELPRWTLFTTWFFVVLRLPVYFLNSCSPLLQYSSDSKTNQDSFFLVVLQQNLPDRNASCHTIHRKDLSRNQSTFHTFRRRNMYSRDPIKTKKNSSVFFFFFFFFFVFFFFYYYYFFFYQGNSTQRNKAWYRKKNLPNIRDDTCTR